jgi:hypothetical protein
MTCDTNVGVFRICRVRTVERAGERKKINTVFSLNGIKGIS